MRPRLTLSIVFWGSSLLLIGLLAGLFFYIQRASDETVTEGATRQRDTAMAAVERQVLHFLGVPREKIEELRNRFASGDCSIADRKSAESCLLGALASHVKLQAVSLTYGKLTGENDAEDLPVVEANGRWQLMVYRTRAGASSPLCSRWVERGADGKYSARTVCREPTALLLDGKPLGDATPAEDPTETGSFRYVADEGWDPSKPTPSDLSWWELDLEKPVTERRIIVSTVNKMVGDHKEFFGVIKASILFDELSETIRTTKVNPDEGDPFHVFLCDGSGRLITGFAPKDVPVDADEESLRVDSACAPPEVRAALQSGEVENIRPDRIEVDGTLQFEGHPYLAAFRGLRASQTWAIGIVGPEDFYRDKVNKARVPMLIATSAILFIVTLLSLLTLRAVSNSLRRIVTETDRMQQFDFTRHDANSAFADVHDALDGLERAKTAVRAMGRYVPLELVRRLFREDKEPVPGGQMREVTVMFTDIAGFTTLVEKERPDVVAAWLGQYLSVMTGAVHGLFGTVDKFIGDAVMAVWNAPIDDKQHVEHACLSALRCVADSNTLFKSKEWEGRPPLITRFGLHVTTAMVGNFGSPDRLSYTAIGDGVNLASRLEGLNKEYGTSIIVSGEVVARVATLFEFRKLDKVAVKGKALAIEVYELIGERGCPRSSALARYEEALAAYFRRDFDAARGLLDKSDDPPSQTLSARCKQLQQEPPPKDWDGVWTLHTK